LCSLLSINNYYYRRGGAEVVFLEQNQLFEDDGWTVTPFSMKHDSNIESQYSKYFIEEIEYGQDYSLFEKILRVPKVIYSKESQKNIQLLIDAVRPDVAHAHNIYHHISPSIFKTLKKNNIPVVMTLHDLKLACPAYKMLAHDGVCERCKNGKTYNVVIHKCVKDSFSMSALIMLETMVHKSIGIYRDHVDKFVVPSQFYVNKLVEWGWPRDKFIYIPNFVNINAVGITRKAGNYFIYFGRLSHEKGIETLIQSVARAGVSLKVVGTGPIEQDMKDLAAKLNADIEFAGFKTGDALYQLIAEARATVLPAEWYENAPISILESYYLSTPVIGADIGGIPEMIKVGETGDVFKSGSVEALTDMLKRYSAFSDGELTDLGDEACLWVKQNFSHEQYLDRMKKLYASLGVSVQKPL